MWRTPSLAWRTRATTTTGTFLRCSATTTRKSSNHCAFVPAAGRRGRARVAHHGPTPCPPSQEMQRRINDTLSQHIEREEGTEPGESTSNRACPPRAAADRVARLRQPRRPSAAPPSARCRPGTLKRPSGDGRSRGSRCRALPPEDWARRGWWGGAPPCLRGAIPPIRRPPSATRRAALPPSLRSPRRAALAGGSSPHLHLPRRGWPDPAPAENAGRGRLRLRRAGTGGADPGGRGERASQRRGAAAYGPWRALGPGRACPVRRGRQMAR